MALHTIQSINQSINHKESFTAIIVLAASVDQDQAAQNMQPGLRSTPFAYCITVDKSNHEIAIIPVRILG